MPAKEEHRNIATLTWGLFLLLALSAVFVAVGIPLGPVLLLSVVLILAFSFRYIYLTLYLGIAMMPFLGIMVSIPTGSLAIGARAFGGSIDISLGECILFFVAIAWGCKLLIQWYRRRDQSWRPRLPLIGTYLLVFAAHLVSAFSPLEPDPILVVKYAFRPVLYDYLAFIVLPVNLLRSRKRYVAALGVLVAVGVFAALNGLVSIFFPVGGGLVGRVHPLPIFGVDALGENWNELADLLVFTVPFTLALAGLVKKPQTKRLLQYAAAFQFFIALLTFARTIWIAFALQALFLCFTVWREAFKRHLSMLLVLGVVLLPLGISMAAYSVSQTAEDSNSTRLMLTGIALELYASSPWVGAGAGTFLSNVGSTQVFLIEYGDPLDSHGFVQKLLAETGTVGIVAMGLFLAQLSWLLWKGREHIRGEALTVYALLISGTFGAFIYQCFNTDYWTGKLWLPVGLLLAGMNVLRISQTKETGQNS
ncbi:MAG: O-antigen ligase family protein [Patescibacteria group bacterium]